MNTPSTEKPKFKSYFFASMILGLPFILLSMSSLKTEEWQRQLMIDRGEGDPYFRGGYLLVMGIVILIVIWCVYLHNYNRYKLSIEHPEEYSAMVEKEERQKRINEEIEKRNRELQQQMTPACPVCGSKNIKRLSTTNRAVSVAMVGLASAKIGKQYQCNNCKHLW